MSTDEHPTVEDYARGWAETYIGRPEKVEVVVEQVLQQIPFGREETCWPELREYLNQFLEPGEKTVRQIYVEAMTEEVDRTFAEIVAEPFARLDLGRPLYKINSLDDTLPDPLARAFKVELREHFETGALQPLPRVYRLHGAEGLRAQLDPPA